MVEAIIQPREQPRPRDVSGPGRGAVEFGGEEGGGHEGDFTCAAIEL